MSEPSIALKPRLRGVSHQWACLGTIPMGVALVALAESSTARAACSVYAGTLTALFGISALYHRVDWRSAARRGLMRRLDHSMIFVLIAGTYTPFALLGLHGALGLAILATVWAGAVIGVVLTLAWPDAPKPVQAIIYVALGWVALGALPQLAAAIGVDAVALLALGGALYTVGAVVYALGRPDPVPSVFGYHEVFHVLVILAAAVQYTVIAVWLLPR